MFLFLVFCFLGFGFCAFFCFCGGRLFVGVASVGLGVGVRGWILVGCRLGRGIVVFLAFGEEKEGCRVLVGRGG